MLGHQLAGGVDGEDVTYIDVMKKGEQLSADDIRRRYPQHDAVCGFQIMTGANAAMNQTNKLLGASKAM